MKRDLVDRALREFEKTSEYLDSQTFCHPKYSTGSYGEVATLA